MTHDLDQHELDLQAVSPDLPTQEDHTKTSDTATDPQNATTQTEENAEHEKGSVPPFLQDLNGTDAGAAQATSEGNEDDTASEDAATDEASPHAEPADPQPTPAPADPQPTPAPADPQPTKAPWASDEEAALRSLDLTMRRPLLDPVSLWPDEHPRQQNTADPKPKFRIPTGVLVAVVAAVSFVAGGLTARLSAQMPLLVTQKPAITETQASYEQKSDVEAPETLEQPAEPEATPDASSSSDESEHGWHYEPITQKPDSQTEDDTDSSWDDSPSTDEPTERTDERDQQDDYTWFFGPNDNGSLSPDDNGSLSPDDNGYISYDPKEQTITIGDGRDEFSFDVSYPQGYGGQNSQDLGLGAPDSLDNDSDDDFGYGYDRGRSYDEWTGLWT